MMMVDYPPPNEHTVVLVSVMTNDGNLDTIIRGQHGTIAFGDGEIELREQGTWWPEFRKANADIAPPPPTPETMTPSTNSDSPNPAANDAPRATAAPASPWGMAKNDKGEERPVPPPGQATCRIATEPRPDHMGHFLGAIRKECEVSCNVNLGCSTMVAIKMAVESYRHDKALLWDAEKKAVIGL